jgi:predicted outer membrane repeat protein
MSLRPTRSISFLVCTLVALVIMGAIPSFAAQAAAFNIPNGDVAALISAINQANASAGKDEINLAPGGVYTFNAIDNEYVEIQNNKPVAFGANAMPQINSNITINGNGATLQRDPLFSSCNASNELRLFWVNASGKLALNNVTVKNGCVGDYGSGGAIFARDGGTVTVIGSTFENNNTTGIVLDGGAITVDSGFLFVENSNFIANTSTYVGGAISLDSSTGVINNSNFTSNTNTSSGGAVAGDWNSDVTIYNSTFTANSANHGGAVVSRDSSKMRLSNVMFVGNSTVFDGGAVQNEGGIMTITNSTFSGNTATSAGAVNNDNVTGGKMYIFNSTFADNVAESFGGGAINNGGDELYVFNTTFTNNTAPDTDFGGGAIYSHLGAVTLMNVSITGSTTPASGGAIYSSGDFLNISKTIISGNSANNGGALETYTTNTVIHSSTITNNTADNGDAFFKGNGGAIVNQNVMTIVNSTIAGNSATGYESLGEFFGGGGAIYTTDDFVAETPTLTLINTTISGNSSDMNGGAIFVDETGDLELRNVTITGNSADKAGGGIARTIDDIFPEDAEIINIARSIIVGNSGGDCDNQDYVSGGNNVMGSTCPTVNGDTVANSAGNVLNTTLANNGGFTFTHALTAGSPAINKGGAGCASVDQRGFTRSGACDAGAFELGGTASNAPGLLVAPSGGSNVVSEKGLTDTYGLTLASAPTGIVTVKVITNGEVAASPATVIFTPQNWNAPQNVTVSAVVDYLTEPAHTGLIAHTLVSADPMYNGAPTNTVQVNINADSGNGGDPGQEGQLVVNGGFETAGGSNSEAANWSLKNSTGDKRKCNKDDKVVAHGGTCAVQFKGGPGESSQIQQKVNGVSLPAGAKLTMSVWVQGKKATGGASVSAKITYGDNTKGKLSVDIEAGTYNYKQLVPAPLTLEKATASIKIAVKSKMASGKVLVDDLSVVYSTVAGAENDLLGLPGESVEGGAEQQADLLALPTAEAAFSTNQ